MKTLLYVVLVTAALVTVTAGCRVRSDRSDLKIKGDYHLTVLIYRAGGACATLTTPQLSVARGDAITWDVVVADANCASHGAVSIRNFVRRSNGESKQPLEADPGTTLKFHVKTDPGEAPYDYYKYSVFLGETASEDPEIDINR
jgi:hypothetical protein